MNHTPEPWEADYNISAIGRVVATLGTTTDGTSWFINAMDPIPDREVEANAHRIVACVNACEGIDDPTKLRAQRDALLEAAKAIADMAEVLRTGSHTPHMLNATRHKIMRDAANAADIARTAIAAVEEDAR